MTRRLSIRMLRLEDRLAPAVATWDGGGADNHWTTAANWVGDVAPQVGDDLVFPAGAARLTNTNDFAAETGFASISITGDGYDITGNSVNLTNGLSANFPFNTNSTLAINIAGSGGVTKAGSGRLVLSGDNSYTGQTIVSAGALTATNDNSLGATGPGNDSHAEEDGVLEFDGSQSSSGLTINETITFSGASNPSAYGGIVVLGGRVTFAGPLMIDGDAIFYVYSGIPTITSGISEIGGSRNLGIGRVTFASSSVSAVSGTVRAGGVNFNGTGPFGLIEGRGIGGTGTIGPVIATDGVIEPGATTIDGGSPLVGTLHTGDLSIPTLPSYGNLLIEITPTGSDQVDVHGSVSLAGSLGLQFRDGFEPSATTRIRLIDNDGNDPVTGHFLNLPEGGLAARFADNDLIITYHGGDGNDVEVYAVPAVSMRRFAVGEGAGGTPTVHVYDGNGQVIRSFIAYESTFHGGVHVATGDVNGDGVPDVITAPGVGGGPVIRVWDGITGLMVKQFNAYDPNFRGGASVAFAANWIITGAGPGGGPHVKVFNPVSGTVLFSFMAYDPSFTGGVSVAGLDEGSNGHIVIPAQVITGAGPGGGPHVKVFSLRDFPGTVTEIGSFMAYDPAFRGGVNVAAHGSPAGAPDFQGLITSPASNGGPDVRSYDLYGRRLGGLLAYDPHFFGGVTVAFLPTGPNDAIELITGAGSGGGPHVKVISSANGTPVVRLSFLAFDPGFTGGIYVG